MSGAQEVHKNKQPKTCATTYTLTLLRELSCADVNAIYFDAWKGRIAACRMKICNLENMDFDEKPFGIEIELKAPNFK